VIIEKSKKKKDVKVSPNRPWRAKDVSCDVGISSAYEEVKVSPVTGRGGL
jgi:hypothetical protein